MSKKIIIGKPINGISLNGNEWLMDGADSNQLMKFDSKQEAIKFLKENGNIGDWTDEEIEDSFVFEFED